MDFIESYLNQLGSVLRELSRCEIAEVVNVLFDAWQRRARVFLIGNGGSAATASHMANDLNKLTIIDGLPRFRALALTDNVPLITAWGNDSAYARVFVEQLLNFLEPGDVVLAISCSGNSPNILAALEAACQHDAITIGLGGRTGGRMATLVDHCVCVPSDHIGQQEDAHLILGHLIANILREMAIESQHLVGAA